MADPTYLVAARRAVQAAAALRALQPMAKQNIPAAAGAAPAAEAEDQADTGLQDEGLHDELLGVHLTQYEDPVGPPIGAKLAAHATNIWSKGRDITKVKEISTRQFVPSNIAMCVTEVNPEIVANLGKFGMARDRRWKAIHALTMRSLTPVLKIAHMAMRPEAMVRKDILDHALDTVALLGGISASVNHIRRDNARAKLGPKGKTLCPQEQVVHTSNLLMGENLASRIRTTSQQVNLLRGAGYNTRFRSQRFQPYQRGTGYNNNNFYGRRGARFF